VETSPKLKLFCLFFPLYISEVIPDLSAVVSAVDSIVSAVDYLLRLESSHVRRQVGLARAAQNPRRFSTVNDCLTLVETLVE
jgi:hypothetical protein